MLRDSRDKPRTALWERSRLWPLWGGGAKKGRVFRLSERSGERLKSRHRYCITERSEFEKAGGLAVGAQRRASIFRFSSAHKGKSFSIAADAEMTNVLPGVWLGSLTSVVDYISGLTAGKRLIPFCPSGKSSVIGAIAEMADGFLVCRIFKKKNKLV